LVYAKEDKLAAASHYKISDKIQLVSFFTPLKYHFYTLYSTTFISVWMDSCVWTFIC
jgi:hypothetical protein